MGNHPLRVHRSWVHRSGHRKVTLMETTRQLKLLLPRHFKLATKTSHPTPPREHHWRCSTRLGETLEKGNVVPTPPAPAWWRENTQTGLQGENKAYLEGWRASSGSAVATHLADVTRHLQRPGVTYDSKLLKEDQVAGTQGGTEKG